MSQDKIVKIVRTNIPTGSRDIGWPRRRWSGNIDAVSEARSKKDSEPRMEEGSRKPFNSAVLSDILQVYMWIT